MREVISETARVSQFATLADSVQVWHLAEVRERAKLGSRVIVGSGSYIGVGVEIGDDSKVQNHALIYDPASLGKGVFIGPGAILTNDRYPRAVNERMQQKSALDWKPVGVTVLDGASIGAGVICVAPVTIGSWSMVAAGAVVLRDVADYALVVGNPARQIGWVGRSGSRLIRNREHEGRWRCEITGESYEEVEAGGIRLMNEPVASG